MKYYPRIKIINIRSLISLHVPLNEFNLNYWRVYWFLFVFGATTPQWARASSFMRFLDHTQRRTTFGRTPLDEWSACRWDLYLTTHNTHNREIFMPPVGFEPTISAGERPQTYALDSAATGTGIRQCIKKKQNNKKNKKNKKKSSFFVVLTNRGKQYIYDNSDLISQPLAQKSVMAHDFNWI